MAHQRRMLQEDEGEAFDLHPAERSTFSSHLKSISSYFLGLRCDLQMIWGWGVYFCLLKTKTNVYLVYFRVTLPLLLSRQPAETGFSPVLLPFQESSSKATPSGMVMARAVPHSSPAPRMETNCRLFCQKESLIGGNCKQPDLRVTPLEARGTQSRAASFGRG